MPTIAQRYEPAFPIGDLIEHPDNPRRGDEAAIEASMSVHGFYGSVLVQESTRRIIAGNHRTRVARRLGETTVPVVFVDVDDDQARRLLLVDNRTNDTATYDDRELARLLEQLADEPDALAGTGFYHDDLVRLLVELEEADPDMPTVGDERYTPQWIFDGMALVFDLDVAAPVNITHRRAPARRHLCIHDDGLTAPWEGLVWMNPPFSGAANWARRWMAHPDGVCILSISNQANSTIELWEHCDLFVLATHLVFDSPVVAQRGDVLWPLFMAAQGAGAPGLERLAEAHNWPVLHAMPRPRPGEPLDFGRRSAARNLNRP